MSTGLEPPSEAHIEAEKALLEKLEAFKITPYHETSVDSSLKRPLGHDTHNLFVKDKKSKQLLLITVHQDVKVNLKTLAKELGYKELRLASSEDTRATLKVDRGCITVLKLVNDTDHKVKSVIDKNLIEREDRLCMCSGCADALDHTQHKVVDIMPEVMLRIVRESGHEPLVHHFTEGERSPVTVS